PWELYDLDADPSECTDLAAQLPERLAQLEALWWDEAERHGVLPLDDRTIELFNAHPSDHSPHRPDRRYVYRPPMRPVPSGASPGMGGFAFDLTARVTRSAGEGGVIWSTGTSNAGCSVFVEGDRFVIDYNAFGDHTILESSVELPDGDSELRVRFQRTSSSTGVVELFVDGEACGRADIPYYMRIVSSVGSSLGRDHGSPVSPRYDAPFPFAGTLHEVEIVLPRRRDAEQVAAEAASEMARQ
ncbi:MAG: arylsulfatase, partial [Actinomycetota bacterium]